MTRSLRHGVALLGHLHGEVPHPLGLAVGGHLGDAHLHVGGLVGDRAVEAGRDHEDVRVGGGVLKKCVKGFLCKRENVGSFDSKSYQ